MKLSTMRTAMGKHIRYHGKHFVLKRSMQTTDLKDLPTDVLAGARGFISFGLMKRWHVDDPIAEISYFQGIITASFKLAVIKVLAM